MKKFKALLTVLLALFLLTGCGISEIVSRFVGEKPDAAVPDPTSANQPADATGSTEASSTDAPSEESTYNPQVFYVMVNDLLIVRSGPGTEYAQVRSLPRGHMVTVLYFSGNWAYIGDGWVSREYLSEFEVTDNYYDPGSVVSSHGSYQIVRADRSYYTYNGQVVISHYYDYAVLNGSSAAIRKINSQLYHLADEFLWSDETMNNHARDKQYNPNHPWYYTKTSRVSFVDNQYVHITVSMSWYMGGSVQNSSEDYIFDLITGDPAPLSGSIAWGY